MIMGLLMLLSHLGRPERAWRVITTFNPQSMLSWGVWFLNIFGLLAFIYTALLFIAKENAAKVFAYLGLFFALLTATYTAVHIARAPDKLLWHTTLMPVLFLNGALISGIAVVMLFSASGKNAQLLSKLGKLVGWLIILEFALLFSEVVMLLNGGTESSAVARSLLSGRIGFLFLGVEIVLGTVVPAAILLKGKANALLQIVASFLILIGIFTMRYIVIVGGQLIG